MKHLSALSRGGGLAVSDEQKETPQGSQPAVASRDRSAASGFDVLEERSHFCGGQVIQGKLCHRPANPIRREAEE
jgi:hypothetical protein